MHTNAHDALETINKKVVCVFCGILVHYYYCAAQDWSVQSPIEYNLENEFVRSPQNL